MLRDHLPVTLGRAFLGTEQTEGRGDLQQAGDEQVAGPPEELSVWGTPVLGYPAAMADRVELQRPPRSISMQAVEDVRPGCVLWLRAVAAAPAPARPRPPARRSHSSG